MDKERFDDVAKRVMQQLAFGKAQGLDRFESLDDVQMLHELDRQERLEKEQKRLRDNRSLRAALRGVRSEYGIRVRVHAAQKQTMKVLGVPDVKVQWRECVSDVLGDVQGLQRQLAEYPPEFYQHCRVKKIAVVDELVVLKSKYFDQPKEVAGLASEVGTMIVTPSNGVGVAHHELLHMADFAQMQTSCKHLDQWVQMSTRLNRGQQPYVYRRYWQDPRKFRRRRKGFARGYGLVDKFEERSTTHELSRELGKRLTADRILNRKVKSLRTDLLRWSKGRMNDQYYVDLLAKKVNKDYWHNREVK